MFGQRTLTGRIIDENLEVLPGAKIYDEDTFLLGETDSDGYFELSIPDESNKLILSWIGYEWTSISVPSHCKLLEVVLQPKVLYHYRSHRKIDRLRKGRFEKLPEIHRAAFQKGLFKSESACFQREFIEIKPELDAIRAKNKVKRKQIRKNFEELVVGDTIRIPYSGSKGYDGTDRTSLFVYSYVSDGDNYACVIKGVIVDKNKHRRGYNLIYKVTDIGKCKYDSIIYNGEEMAVGRVLQHNMKYYKILLPTTE